MKRLVALLAVLLAAGCQQAPLPLIVDPPMCRVTPDGAPPWLTGDRGIGGTGTFADRGIGGTGIASDRGIGGTGVEADRGIGGTGIRGTGIRGTGIRGTGIVGIVSGFGSICVDGMEVSVAPNAPVMVDGAPGRQADLRIGQVVAIPATDRNKALSIAVRHEVSGPVETVVSTQPGIVVVAGQRVRVPSSAVGSATIQPGAWVEVSGLRDEDGDIAATRIDPRPPGGVMVRGPMLRLDGQISIGDLPVTAPAITPPAATTPDAGSYVVARGEYVDGVLRGKVLKPDTLFSNPPAWFGPGTKRLVLATHARFEAGEAVLNGGYHLPLASGVKAPVNQPGIVVLYLQAQPGGSFAVTGFAAIKPLATTTSALSGHTADSNLEPAASKPAAMDSGTPPSTASPTNATTTMTSDTADGDTDTAATDDALAEPKATAAKVTNVATATPATAVTPPTATTPAPAATTADPDLTTATLPVEAASTAGNITGSGAGNSSAADTMAATAPNASTAGTSISTTAALKPGAGMSTANAGEDQATEGHSSAARQSASATRPTTSLAHPTISRIWAGSAATWRLNEAASPITHNSASFRSNIGMSSTAHAAGFSAAHAAGKALSRSSVSAFRSFLPKTLH